jgi:hypothetical protein
MLGDFGCLAMVGPFARNDCLNRPRFAIKVRNQGSKPGHEGLIAILKCLDGVDTVDLHDPPGLSGLAWKHVIFDC